VAAALVTEIYGADALLLVMPSDHVIDRVEEFHAAIDKGEVAARNGSLVTFGLRPSSPDTGYGYLKMSSEVSGCPGVREVSRFVEKPNLDMAETMLATGDHLWNAGIFLFRADAVLAETERFVSLISQAALAALVEKYARELELCPMPTCWLHVPVSQSTTQ
jgi:mannose-1-phosphate guanylyltransferase/mannose-1-phosphate guanylyltransferase/mannose-6-phosphate isomerase